MPTKQWPPARVFVVTDETCTMVVGGADNRKDARVHAKRQREVIPEGCDPCRFAVREYRLVPAKRSSRKTKKKHALASKRVRRLVTKAQVDRAGEHGRKAGKRAAKRKAVR